MQTIIRNLENTINKKWLEKHIKELYTIERRQTFPAYQAAAKYVYDLLTKESFEAEFVDVPADGKTVYQDKRMPIGWDVSNMKLTLVSEVAGIKNSVIADYTQNPLSAVKHSVSTPEGGIMVRLVTEEQMKCGEDVSGQLVLLENGTRPQGEIIEMLLDLGAIGWVADYCENPLDAPDTVSWTNAGTETVSWHVQADDRDFIAFNITPRVGHHLRKAVQNETVMVNVESDGRRYETTLPFVTGLLKGESDKEIWITAHLYEPLIDDNSNGVTGAVATLKALRHMSEKGDIKLKYSVRVIFASELYGFASAADYFGGDLSEKTIAGINYDGMPGSKEKGKYRSLSVYEAPEIKGNALNVLLHSVCDAYKNLHTESAFTINSSRCMDDLALGDSTVGVPMTWFIHGKYKLSYHHNSILADDYLDIDLFFDSLIPAASWVCAAASLSGDTIRAILPDALKYAQEFLQERASDCLRFSTDAKKRINYFYKREYERITDFKRWADIPEIYETAQKITVPELKNTFEKEEKNDRPFYDALNTKSWFDYCDEFIFTRLTCGLPTDMTKIKERRKQKMRGMFVYYPVAELLSGMDGKKTLKTIIEEYEWRSNRILPQELIRTCLYECINLAEHGYLRMEAKNTVRRSDIEKAFCKLGIKQGETLVVHSSMSGLGYIEGGADTVKDAIQSVIGEAGTFMVPIFSSPYIMLEGEVNKSLKFRPYDMRPDGALRDKAVTTGEFPKELIKKKGIIRSNHSTHEWLAMGKNAKELMDGHGFFDAPAGETSPLHKALKKNGSVIFFGCRLASNTFLHYLEYIATDIPKPATIKYIIEDGKLKTGFLEKQYPGKRDFYRVSDGEFYDKAIKKGLKIYSAECGIGHIYRIELKNLFDIGMEMIKEDPNVTVGK